MTHAPQISTRTDTLFPYTALFLSNPYGRPLATIGDELDAMAYFDDVFIPWGQVQHVGNPDHAKWYPQRQFDWVHLETQIRNCVHAELMVGLGLQLVRASCR